VTRPWWHPEDHARRRPALLARGRLVATIRAFFAEHGFVEVETPALQVSPGLEPHLMAFSTELVGPDGARAPRHLHTSPEFAMKKLLAAGEKRIFQLARVFRNGERAATHHPEFTMLEWYRAGADYRDLMADCEALLRAVQAAAGRPYAWDGRTADAAGSWREISVVEAFRRFAEFDLEKLLGDRDGLARAVAGLGLRVAEGDGWEDLFFRVFLDRIEPRLGHPTPTILRDYPISMAALARPKPGDPRFAERFEVYVCGLELANAFSELTDAKEQARRFAADMAFKRQRYGFDYPVDPDFLAALEHMPPSAGIALGVDRLIMLALGAARIEDVLWAPVA